MAIGVVLVAAALAGPTPAIALPSAGSAAFHRLLDEDWEARLREDPLLASSVGDHRYDDRLSSVAPADLERAAERRRSTLARLRAIERGALETETASASKC